jgi:hypothetical protein
VTAFTDKWWAGLTEQSRDDDERLGLPQYRYLELVGHQADQLEQLVDRVLHTPESPTELFDEALTGPWARQVRGATAALIGTAGHVAQAAQTALTGSKYVRVIQHWGDDPLVVMVRTRTSETPSSSAVLAAIKAHGAKPAHIEILHSTYEAPWDTVTAAYPTWADWEARTWAEIEETGAPDG